MQIIQLLLAELKLLFLRSHCQREHALTNVGVKKRRDIHANSIREVREADIQLNQNLISLYTYKTQISADKQPSAFGTASGTGMNVWYTRLSQMAKKKAFSGIIIILLVSPAHITSASLRFINSTCHSHHIYLIKFVTTSVLFAIKKEKWYFNLCKRMGFKVKTTLLHT